MSSDPTSPCAAPAPGGNAPAAVQPADDLARRRRFVKVISHDMRQPFQAMRLFLHLLENSLAAGPQADLAAKLARSLDAAEGQMNALMEMSALDAGMIEPNAIEFPLQTLFDRLADDLEAQAERSNTRLRVVPTRLKVSADPGLLDRVLRHLAGNALRFGAGSAVLIGARRRGSRVQLEVRDAGPGIAAADQARLFEEFERGTAPPGDGSQGLGLGLPIVRRTIELMGHRLALHSAPGRGTRVVIELPMPGAAVAPAPAPKPSPAAAPRRVVAVLEDEALQLAALKAMLEDWGHRAIGAPDCDRLLAELQREHAAPQLLITDFHLPGGSTGLDSIARLREAFGLPIPALLLTGDAGAAGDGLPGGVTVEAKPVMPGRLRKRVQKLLDGDR